MKHRKGRSELYKKQLGTVFGKKESLLEINGEVTSTKRNIEFPSPETVISEAEQKRDCYGERD